jgi:hypothetical protein
MVLGERQTDLRHEIDLAGTIQPGQRFRRILMFFGWQLWKRFYASVCTAAGFSFLLSVRTL